MILDPLPCFISQVLAQAVVRVSADWERKFGFKPLLMETFVSSQGHRIEPRTGLTLEQALDDVEIIAEKSKFFYSRFVPITGKSAAINNRLQRQNLQRTLGGHSKNLSYMKTNSFFGRRFNLACVKFLNRSTKTRFEIRKASRV